MRLLVNARWLPFVIAHGLLDELVPFTSVLFQVHELDRLAYRYRFSVYPTEDHIGWVFEDEFDDPVSHMGTGLRQGDPGHITFTWYPQLVRHDLGIGPHQVWWLSQLTADPDTTAGRGERASVDARSHARPDPTRTTRRRRGFEPDLDLSPGLYTELLWRIGYAVDPLPSLALNLSHVAGLTVDVARAGLASLKTSTINVVTDTSRRSRSPLCHRNDGAARRSADRSVSGGSGGSTHHHVGSNSGQRLATAVTPSQAGASTGVHTPRIVTPIGAARRA